MSTDMLKATKVRIYPTVEQADYLNQQFGAVRFVYNKALGIKTHYRTIKGVHLKPIRDLKPLIATAKQSHRYGWLKDYDSIALQQSVRNLDQAYRNAFNPNHPARLPTFKSKRGKQSSYHCTSISFGENWVKVPKCSAIKARIHRPIEGTLKSITLSRTSTNKYYASLLVDDERDAPTPQGVLASDQVRGVDMGINDLVVTDTGVKIPNPRFVEKAYRNLRCKQKALSRCEKGTRGRSRARLKVAKAHERLANARADFQHKLSKQLIDENQAVVVETLKVKHMMQNRCLAKAIGDAGWHSLIAKLEYKAERAGKRIVKIDQWFASSKICSQCTYKADKLPLSVRNWTCPDCGVNHDRDLNAARNIKQQGIIKLQADGLAVSAHGGPRKSSSDAAA